MSNKQDNQALINRTKQYLKEYGYEVKTSHLYEVFAKLVNEPNWHVAKAKNIDFSNVIYKSHSLEELVKNIDNLDPIKVIYEIHNRLNHKVQVVEKGNNLGLNLIANMNKDIKIAIMYRPKPKDSLVVSGKTIEIESAITNKHIINMVKSMNIHECNRGIIYSSANSFNDKLYQLAIDHHIEIIDFEDLTNFAYRIDHNKETLAKAKNINFFNVIYEKESLENLVKNIDNLDSIKVISEIHKRLDHKIELVDSNNELCLSHIVTMSKDTKIAIMTRASASPHNKVSAKHVLNLIKAMNNYECNRGIIYTSSSGVVKSLYDLAKENNIEIVDHEDMINMANRMDSGLFNLDLETLDKIKK